MVIYLDVLLLSNLWINYLLLNATAKWTHRRIKARDIFFAAVIGTASALIIFMPPLPLLVSLCVRIAAAFVMIRISFGKQAHKTLLALTFWFSVQGCLFCGVIETVGTFLLPFGFQIVNSVLYMDISLLVLLFASVLASFIASFSTRRHDMPDTHSLQLHLRIENIDYLLDALPDTGNNLRDVYSGKPVVICSENSLQNWLQDYPDVFEAVAKRKSFRLIPAETVIGKQPLPAFQPDCIALKYADNEIEKPIDAMLAITKVQTAAIVPACCLQ